ncbi:MAG: sulfatase-like hydrolase/transferase [Lachnospiraceae bacterium]|nr:sulfatase-like hydrolase/transferase [Lachnospiraceae bacterium]
MNGKKRKTAEDFGENFRQLRPAYVIWSAFCFMLFVYEPLLMYSTNKNDFWFDFGIMIFPTLVIFALFLLAGAVLITAFYFIADRLSKGKAGLYQCAVTALFVVFLATYMQGVYLSTSLPVLTGETIAWDQYLREDLLTLFLGASLEIAAIALIVKFGTEPLVRWEARISAVIVVMLLAGLLPQMIMNNAFQKKDALITTNAHFNDVSSNKNFLILLVDAVDADGFEAVLKSNETYRDVFRDFTYYSNTASVYPFTRDSMPLLLTGDVNRNEQEFSAYASEAYNSSPLLERLDAENYDMGIYMDEPVWYGERRFHITSDIKNDMASPYENMNFVMYFRQEMKYILFKYLPYAYKQYSRIEGFDFGMALEMYNYRYDSVYNMMLENPELVKTDRNVFQFVHVEGAHLPFECDKDLNPVEKGTYSQKIEATIKVIDTWLSRLKSNDAYDNSVILIMADHGYYDVDHDSYGEEVLERFHPILLVKGRQEKHELIESDVPVSHTDLMDAYMELLDGKKSGEIFHDMASDRKRQVIWYEYRNEEHMVEYELEGNRFERQDFKPTGRVFDR